VAQETQDGVISELIKIYKEPKPAPKATQSDEPNENSLKWRCWECKQTWSFEQMCSTCFHGFNDFPGENNFAILVTGVDN